MLRFFMNDELQAELPAESLVLGGGAPVYERKYEEPKYFQEIKSFNIDKINEPKDIRSIADQLISLPGIASKRWIYNQYDSMVGTGNTNTNQPSDAAVVAVKETGKALAITTDCNSRYVFADPYVGCMIAVSEAARNIVCSGGQPLGVTNCLNFGNPYDPEVYYQFVHAIKGMGEACKKFDTPVTGGNVSFYNQSPSGAVYPTPTIGMVGSLEDINDKMTLDFKTPGDVIYLLGEIKNDINSSEYLHKLLGIEFSPAPYFNLDEEYKLHRVILSLIKNRLINSAHDVSEGGLFVTLAESGFNRELGFSVKQTDDKIRKDAFWFGESQGRVVVSVSIDKCDEFEKAISDFPFKKLGIVTTGQVKIDNEEWGDISLWKEKYDTAIEKYFKNYLPE
jgi:phosphoribosylformylglycinamidine synthase